MHMNDEVALFSLDAREYIESVISIDNKELLPCVASDDVKAVKLGLQRWLLLRNLGRTRSDYSPYRKFYGNNLFVSKHKISLYDKYWIKNAEKKEDIKWEDIDPLTHWDYEDDSYFSLLFDPEDTEEVDNESPNLTLPGNEKRFWYKISDELGIINGDAQKDMALYKKAVEAGAYRYVTPRSYTVIKGTIYSFKPVRVNEYIERIPFDVYYDTYADESKSKLENLKTVCEEIGLTDWRDFFSCVIQADKAVGNKERELSELGVLRDVNTLRVVGFDSI